jgi:transcriptional regulator with XRE-family HTH domain
MGQTIRSRRLGSDLRQLRRKVNLTADAVAEELGFSQSKVSRIESGEVRISRTDLKALLGLYGVTEPEQVEAFVAAARNARTQGWWIAYEDALPREYADYIALEATAKGIRDFEAMIVPGLAQTSDYTRHLLAASPEIVEAERAASLIQVRADRQRLILDNPHPPRVWMIVGEGALRQQVGGSKVMIPQLKHLAELTDLPHLTLQVMPFSAGAYASVDSSFILLDYPGTDPTIAYVANLTGALLMDSQGQVEAFTAAFDSLRATALSPADSLALIQHIRAEL